MITQRSRVFLDEKLRCITSATDSNNSNKSMLFFSEQKTRLTFADHHVRRRLQRKKRKDKMLLVYDTTEGTRADLYAGLSRALSERSV